MPSKLQAARPFLLAAFAFAAVASCDKATAPEVWLASIDGTVPASATVGTAISGLRVRITVNGEPRNGAAITLAPSAGGVVPSQQVVTGTDGYANIGWTLGPAAGKQSLVVTGPSQTSPMSLEVDAKADRPATIQFAKDSILFDAFADSSKVEVTARDRFGNMTSDPAQFTTADAAIARVSAAGFVRALANGLTNLMVTVDTAHLLVPVRVTQRLATFVVEAPPACFMSLGDTLRIRTTARDRNQYDIAAVQIGWSSADTAVASVSGSGLVTSRKNGTATVRAQAIAGATFSDSTKVCVTQQASNVAFSQRAHTMNSIGATLQLAAAVTDARGHMVPGTPITWQALDSTLVTVSSTGLAQSRATGIARVRIAAGTKADTAEITVRQVIATLTTVAVDTMLVGESRGAPIVARDSASTPLPSSAFTWVSRNATVATVDAAGSIRAIAPGETWVVGAGSTHSDSTRIIVQPVPVSRVDIVQDSLTLAPGDTASVTAIVYDSVGGVLQGRAIAWSSAHSSVATVTASGVVSFVSTGRTWIIARAEGKADSIPVTALQSTSTQLSPSVSGAAPHIAAVVTLADSAAMNEALAAPETDLVVYAINSAEEPLLAGRVVNGVTELNEQSTALSLVATLAGPSIVLAGGDTSLLETRIRAHGQFAALASSIKALATSGQSYLGSTATIDQAAAIIRDLVQASVPAASVFGDPQLALSGTIPVDIKAIDGLTLTLVNKEFIAFSVATLRGPTGTTKIAEKTIKGREIRLFPPGVDASIVDNVRTEAGKNRLWLGQSPETKVEHTYKLIESVIGLAGAAAGLSATKQDLEFLSHSLTTATFIEKIKNATTTNQLLDASLEFLNEHKVTILTRLFQAQVRKRTLSAVARLVLSNSIRVLSAGSILKDLTEKSLFFVSYWQYILKTEEREICVTTDGLLLASCPARADIVEGSVDLEIAEVKPLTLKILNSAGQALSGQYQTTWTARDQSVATVDQTGRVTGKAFGETWVVAQVTFGTETFKDSARAVIQSLAGYELELQYYVSENVYSTGANLTPWKRIKPGDALTILATQIHVVRLLKDGQYLEVGFQGQAAARNGNKGYNQPSPAFEWYFARSGPTEITVSSSTDDYYPDYRITAIDKTNGRTLQFPVKLTLSRAGYLRFAGRTIVKPWTSGTEANPIAETLVFGTNGMVTVSKPNTDPYTVSYGVYQLSFVGNVWREQCDNGYVLEKRVVAHVGNILAFEDGTYGWFGRDEYHKTRNCKKVFPYSN